MKNHWLKSRRSIRRYYRFLWRSAFAQWRRRKRADRKQAIKAIEKDYSDENIERQLARDCFGKYRDIGYID